MRREYTILIDEREKKPLRFPAHLPLWDDHSPATAAVKTTVRLHTRTTRLLTGDYQLEGYPHTVICERKGSLDELSTNLLTPNGRRKFIAELVRLREECLRPVILLEGTPLSLMDTQRAGSDAIVARDALLRACLEYNVQLLLVPSSTSAHRDAAAIWLASLLISASFTTPTRLPGCPTAPQLEGTSHQGV
jgi:ERCC4-type nuclease